MAIYTLAQITLDTTVLVNNFESLKIQQSVHGHHKVTLVVNTELLTGSGNPFNGTRQYIGKAMNIEIKPAQGGNDTFRFKGVITALQTSRHESSGTSQCTITGSSPTVLLEDLPHIEAYEDKTLANIAQQLLQYYPNNFARSIRPQHVSRLPYIVQYKENTYGFLSRLCARFSEWFFYDGEQLLVGERNNTRLSPLIYGVNLLSLSINMQVAPTQAKLLAYDYEQDNSVSSSTSAGMPGNVDPYTQTVLQQSRQLFSKEALYKVSQSLGGSPSGAINAMARQLGHYSVMGMVNATGQSDQVGLGPGKTVQITETGPATDHGSYMITEVTHYCTGSGEYHNTFSAVPAAVAVPYTDIYHYPEAEAQSATVVTNHDPAGLGRIRVRFMWQQTGMSPWLRLVSASGGGDKGFYMVPEIGEEVIVEFEDGNPEMPYIMGSVYNGKAKSSFGSAGNDMKAIKTRSGNTILLNDSNGSMSLTDPSGGCIKLNGDGTLEICAPNEIILNTKKVTVDATENITMSKDKIIVDVTANTISKKAEEIKMEGTNTNIKTSNTNITSITNIEGDTTVNGTSVTIRGEVNMN